MAQINDARSHGQLQDNFLSLNEAIQLSNGTLQATQLSPAEYYQVQGFGDVAFATIDWFQIPKITLERDLDPILDTPTQHGFRVGGTGGNRPVIDLKGFKGFVATGTFTIFANMIIKGGQDGITIVQDDTVYGSTVENCSFEGQQGAGIHVLLPTDNKLTRLEFTRNTYTNLPQAVFIEDLGTNRTGQIHFYDEVVTGCTIGHGIVLKGQQGDLEFDIDHLTYTATPRAIWFARPLAAASRKVTVDARFVDVAGSAEAFHFEGSPSSVSRGTLSQCDLAGSSFALALDPAGSNLLFTIRDTRLSGAVTALAAGNTSQVDFLNVRARSGAWTLGSSGAGLVVKDSILDSVALATTGTAPVLMDGVRFVGGSVTGTTAAPVQITGSYLGTVTVGSNVSSSAPLPQAQLGSGDIAPLAPKVGMPLDLKADLPPGLVGYWLLGNATAYAPLDLGVFRFYFDLSSPYPIISIPVGLRLQQKVTLQIPLDPGLIGLPDWLAQMVVGHDSGITAPAINVAPGRRFAIQ
jgi:hypothetical protein